MTMAELQRRADALAPWRYDHAVNGVVIKGMADSAPIHGDFGRGRDVMAHILQTVIGRRDPKALRALDLGCLEGHYTEVLADVGVGDIVAVEWSDEHIARARFVLNELKGCANVSVVQGDVEDPMLLPSLGHFDIVILHGLLYHMRNPVALMDRVARLARDGAPVILLLSTQFKFPFSEIVDPTPLANIKVRKIAPRSDGRVQHETDRSVYAPVAVRLNPAGVFGVLMSTGFRQLIAYDTPTGARYGFQLNIVASTKPDTALLPALQNSGIPGLDFYAWDGRRLDGYDLRCLPSRLVARAGWALRHISERLGGSGARQTARFNIHKGS